MKKVYSRFYFAICLFTFLQPYMNPIRSQNAIIGYTYVGTYDGHGYYLSDCTSDWYNAGVAATEMGGYLVSIKDVEENYFVQSMLEPYSFAWIGLTTNCSSCTWSSGESIEYSNLGCSNGSGYWAIRGAFGDWCDFDAFDPLPYIIEFSSNPDCNNPNKQYVCHNWNTICISNSAVQNHLDHGDFLGPCGGCNDPNSMQILKPVVPATDMKVEQTVAEYYVEHHSADSAETKFSIYPNPASNLLDVLFPAGNESGQLIIHDQVGKRVWSAVPEIHQKAMSVDLAEVRMGPGIYFISFISDGNTVTRKFIVSY